MLTRRNLIRGLAITLPAGLLLAGCEYRERDGYSHNERRYKEHRRPREDYRDRDMR
jgi:hypothetical protein